MVSGEWGAGEWQGKVAVAVAVGSMLNAIKWGMSLKRIKNE